MSNGHFSVSMKNTHVYLYDIDMDQHFHLPHRPLPASARQTFLLQ